jgi:Zn-dependent protease
MPPAPGYGAPPGYGPPPGAYGTPPGAYGTPPGSPPPGERLQWEPPRRRPTARWSAPNVVTTLAILAIVGVVLDQAVKRGYLSTVDLIYILVAIPSIMFHEVSHGIVALWCGDDTAKQAGRITANPIRHVDPVGTIILPVIMALSHGPVFGWAKPVPVRVDRLRHPRNQAVLVGLAGPFSNYLLAAIAGGIMHWIFVSHQNALVGSGWYWAFQVFFYLGFVNVLIGTFNLLPIPPLDGASLVERLLPASALPGYYRVRMGFLVVVLFFVLVDPHNVLQTIYIHVETWYQNLFLS